jgi:energy-coupling factor transporter ATP-binding protein EcfA2
MAGLSSSEVDEKCSMLISLGEEDITIIMIEHIMQAVMRFFGRQMMCSTPENHRDQRAGRGDGQQAECGGLSWHLACHQPGLDAGHRFV